MRRLLVVSLLALALVGCSKGERSDIYDDTVPEVDNVDVLRRVWNGMSAAEQHDVCSGFHLYGADVTADQIQEAAGNLSAEFHDDTVFFLEDLACA
jgi:hypothetical protein